MPRDMKPTSPGRLGALKAMMGGPAEGDETEAPAGDGYGADVDIPGMIEALEQDAMPGASPEKRAHLEKAIAELKMCVGGEKEAPTEMPAEEPEAPAA